MTEARHHRHEQLKAARGALPIRTLETHPTHPAFARKQRCLLSLTEARDPRFASCFASSFPWAQGSRLPVGTGNEQQNQGRGWAQASNITWEGGTPTTATLSALNTASEMGILVTH